MKKTRWKNILRTIRGSLNRFLSIMFIVALGAGFMAGLAAASPDMYDYADRYISDYRLFDIHIKSPIGFPEHAMNELEAMDEVRYLQRSIVTDAVLDQSEGTDFTSRIYGILDENSATELNQIRLTEGRLPEDPLECVVESVIGRYTGNQVSVGDTLTIAEGNQGYDLLSTQVRDTRLTVVGICESPMCISVEGDPTNTGSGTINLNVYVRKSFFTGMPDTDLYLEVSGASGYNTFTPEYRACIQSVLDQIRPMAEPCSAEQAALLSDTLKQQAEEAQSLSGLVRMIRQTQESLRNSQVQGEAQTETIRGILGEESPLSGSLDRVLHEGTGSSSSDPGNPSAAVLEKRLEGLASAAADAGMLLDNSTWIYQLRGDLAGFDSYQNNVGKVSALAKIFPVFFFIVALLVALTTMTRLVEENRLQIGTLKALGYSNGQILFEYLLFSLAASVCGCIIGFTGGFYIFPMAINSAYSMMYRLPSMETPFRWEIVAWVAPVAILSILLAAVWACWNEFRSLPAKLMLPKAPAPGKRIWLEHIHPLWRRLTFTYKVTFRNLFRYKKRFIMTVIGVAGCSALLLTGFGIRDSVNEILDKQFGEIYHYDMLFAGTEDRFAEKDETLKGYLSDSSRISTSMMISEETGKIYNGEESQAIYLMIPEDLSSFPEFVTLRSRTSGDTFALSSDGIILTEKISEEMGIHAGDTITLENAGGRQKEVPVMAITENYVSSFAYLTEACYQDLFSAVPSYNGLLCISADGSDSTAEILSCPGVLYGVSVNSLEESFANSIKSINGVIYVLILAAGLLCIVVLYNLINVNICERRKELATLEVLGFYPPETQRYIFRETNILSLIGTLAGLVIGIWLHAFVVRTVEVNHIMFGREISPLSYLIALAISMLFTLLTNLLTRSSINRTDMVEAMKAND